MLVCHTYAIIFSPSFDGKKGVCMVNVLSVIGKQLESEVFPATKMLKDSNRIRERDSRKKILTEKRLELRDSLLGRVKTLHVV